MTLNSSRESEVLRNKVGRIIVKMIWKIHLKGIM